MVVSTNLLVDVVSPEPGIGSLVGVRGQQRRLVIPNLVNVLNDGEGLGDGFSVVNQNGDLLVDRVGPQQQRAFVAQVLLSAFVVDSLLCEGYSHPHSEWAPPEIQQNHFIPHG